MSSYTAIVGIKPSNSQSWISLPVQPASMEVEIEDVSESDAGRTSDAIMHKKTIRKVTALSLSWAGLDTETARQIIGVFSATEYFQVRYLDPYLGSNQDPYTTKTFYLGNRTVPMYSALLDIWSNVTFKIIER